MRRRATSSSLAKRRVVIGTPGRLPFAKRFVRMFFSQLYTLERAKGQQLIWGGEGEAYVMLPWSSAARRCGSN
mgnify:CR=1 FL=1